MNELIKDLIKSPRTSIGGLCALVGAVLLIIGHAEQGMLLIGIGATLTGVTARDNLTTSEDSGAVTHQAKKTAKKLWKRK